MEEERAVSRMMHLDLTNPQTRDGRDNTPVLSLLIISIDSILLLEVLVHLNRSHCKQSASFLNLERPSAISTPLPPFRKHKLTFVPSLLSIPRTQSRI